MENNTCHIEKELLIDYLLDELSYKETVNLDLHIRNCNSCQEKTESLVHLFNHVREKKEKTVSFDTYLSLKNKIFEKSKQPSPDTSRSDNSYRQKFSFMLSTAAVLLFTFYLAGNMGMFSGAVFDEYSDVPWLNDSSFVELGHDIAQKDDTLKFIDKNTLFQEKHISPSATIETQTLSTPSDGLSRYESHRRNTLLPEENAVLSPATKTQVISKNNSIIVEKQNNLTIVFRRIPERSNRLI